MTKIKKLFQKEIIKRYVYAFIVGLFSFLVANIIDFLYYHLSEEIFLITLKLVASIVIGVSAAIWYVNKKNKEKRQKIYKEIFDILDNVKK